MSLSMFVKTAGLAVAAAFVAFAFYGDGLLFLAKALALALGFSIVFTIFYPQLRGIRRGDRVAVVGSGLPVLFGLGRTGFALNDSGINKEVRVKLEDGKEAIGIVESYEGVLSPPKVRILYEEKLVE
ncbi:Uncharacterised protein [uncultured archaeon]|nr:Uncharacterised protein [uncultured archaeon]